MNKDNKTGGIGFFSLLQLAFIILKLCKVIDWNWFFVLLPAIICVTIILIVFIVFGIALLVELKKTKQNK